MLLRMMQAPTHYDYSIEDAMRTTQAPLCSKTDIERDLSQWLWSSVPEREKLPGNSWQPSLCPATAQHMMRMCFISASLLRVHYVSTPH